MKDPEWNDSDKEAKQEKIITDIKFNRYQLDEPICNTIGRELRSIAIRTVSVFFPCIIDKENVDRDSDLWGPLIFVLVLSTFLAIGAKKDGHIVFATVFFVNLIGASLVTLNAKLLGGKCGFFQNLSLIGYSILPISASGVLLVIFNIFFKRNYYIKILLTLGAFAWSISNIIFSLRSLSTKDKTFLISYPAILFLLYQSIFLLTL